MINTYKKIPKNNEEVLELVDSIIVSFKSYNFKNLKNEIFIDFVLISEYFKHNYYESTNILLEKLKSLMKKHNYSIFKRMEIKSAMGYCFTPTLINIYKSEESLRLFVNLINQINNN